MSVESLKFYAAWAFMAALVIALLVSLVHEFSDGFKNWRRCFVVLGWILAAVAVLILTIWAVDVLKLHYPK